MRNIRYEPRFHRALRGAAIIGIAAIATGWGTGMPKGFSVVSAANTEENLTGVSDSHQSAALKTGAREPDPALTDEGPMPDLGGAIGWLNSGRLNRKSLRGKVVLVDFWTYTCINSLRPLPYVKSWAAKYESAGLVVIGAHTPEFSFEQKRENVETAVRDLKVTYPIAIDSNYEVWRAFNNQYWPAQYLIDGKARIRYRHFGEGEYAEIEHVIQRLLSENGATGLDTNLVSVSGDGVEAAPDFTNERSPETYVGYRQAEHFASLERLGQDSRKTYSSPARLSLNQWALSGSWRVGEESAVPQTAGGKIVFRFHSRDLHLVLGPAKDGNPVRFRVTLDGESPRRELWI